MPDPEELRKRRARAELARRELALGGQADPSAGALPAWAAENWTSRQAGGDPVPPDQPSSAGTRLQGPPGSGHDVRPAILSHLTRNSQPASPRFRPSGPAAGLHRNNIRPSGTGSVRPMRASRESNHPRPLYGEATMASGLGPGLRLARRPERSKGSHRAGTGAGALYGAGAADGDLRGPCSRGSSGRYVRCGTAGVGAGLGRVVRDRARSPGCAGDSSRTRPPPKR